MSKMLFTASVMGHFRAFHIPYLRYFKEKGFEVHIAAHGENTFDFIDKHYDIAFERSPFKLKNIPCYKTLKKIIDQNDYDIIHCHTPVVGILTRLAARKARKKGTIIIYTSHGFHFFKGAPVIQGTITRMLEKHFSRYTDHLITINQEDYDALARYAFKPGACYKVPGVGVDATRFTVQTPENKSKSRKEFGIGPDAYVLVFAAELSTRKNQQMLLKTIGLLKQRIPKVLLLLPGEGPLRSEYEQMIKSLGIEENVRLMGYRHDMDNILLTADIAVSSAQQEGMGINLVEAMAVSLPVVATKIRGHVDLITDSENGFLIDINDAASMADKLLLLYEHPDVLEKMRQKAVEMVKPFLLENAKAKTTNIYDDIIRQKNIR